MLTPLLTHEVGSLAKPAWRVKAAAGRPLAEADIRNARAWGERLGVESHERLLELLRQPSLAAPERREVTDWSSRYGLRFFESAGVDVVYDGEPPELVRDRILYAARIFGGPERLQIMPDCGLRTRSWEIAYRKLASMTVGARLARAAFGL